MSWLLPIIALDVVDEAVVNAKVVRALPVYSSTVTVSHLKTVICPQMTLRREESILSKGPRRLDPGFSGNNLWKSSKSEIHPLRSAAGCHIGT